MRRTFIRTLTELAQEDHRILLLTGDLGFMALEGFIEAFPDRFFNVGVAEQNMVGIATGLAEAGYIPFVYSIAPFAVLRPYEFIRNGPLQHRLPVRIVGVGGGIEYSTNGLSHYALEDVGITRIQPGLAVVAPADASQTCTALKKTYAFPGPVYYRIGKDDRITVPGLEGRFEPGRADILREGSDILLICMGSITCEVADAASQLESHGIHPGMMVVASFNPSPVEDLRQALSRYPLAVTVEAHYIDGGLGSWVAEVIAEYGLACRLHRMGVASAVDGRTGSEAFMRGRLGISRQSVTDTVLSIMSKSKTIDHA